MGVASREALDEGDGALSTREYVHAHRVAARLSIEELAARADVDPRWLAAFEAGERGEELTYDVLLALVRATEPARPDWWDEGHEHDLRLPAGAAGHTESTGNDYWERVEAVRAANQRDAPHGR